METSEQFIKTSRKNTHLSWKARELVHQQPLPQLTQEQYQSRLEHNKYLSTLVKKQRIREVAQFLSKYSGSNHPIQYQSKFNFKQKWQAKQKQSEFQIFAIQYIQGRYFWISLVLMPFILAQIWFISIFRIFQMQNFHLGFVIGLIEEIIAFLMKWYLFQEKVDRKQDLFPQILGQFTRKEGLLQIFNIYSITYYILFIFYASGISQVRNLEYLPLDLIVIIFNYGKVQSIYGKIKFKAFGSKYKNYMHLFDLLSNIFIMLHCFSILLFLCTYYSPDNNWLTISPLNLEKNWINDYLTSIYFSSTTMLTVGYGDLRPTNCFEMLCIILVQLLGISFNAYAINEIGINLSQMRHENESLQRDLSNAEKLATSNKMSKNLKEKMYNEILQHKYTNEQLQISQQNSLMNRINHQIKHQIRDENQIRIAKSCLFFICNFTKRFQINLSRKLQKVLYPPNTTLLQVYGKERLYLITKGQVDVMTQKRYQGRNLPEKVLKTIIIKNKDNIFLSQTYGVSAFFSGKPSRIKAVAKNFTTCYILQQNDIYQTILQGDQDYQKYHYFKIKYNLSKIPEKYQTPLIQNRKQHYAPNLFYLTKRYQIEMRGINTRKNLVRSFRRIKKVREVVEQLDFKQSKQVESFQSDDVQDKLRQNSSGSKEHLQRTSLQQEQQEQLFSIIKPRARLNRLRNPTKYQQLRQLRLKDKYNILIKQQVFKQSYKQYKKYLPKGNISTILKKFHKNELVAYQNNTLISILRQKMMRKAVRK